MKQFFSLSFLFLLMFLGLNSIQAQVSEGTKSWNTQSHSAWKIEPQSNIGYVIVGNRFFSSPNKDLYISQFSEFAQFDWTRTHSTDQNMSTFWKSFCKSSQPPGFFIATTTTSGQQAYTVLTNLTGQKMWDRYSNLPFYVNYGGSCPATNGGYMACGGDNAGNFAVTKFDAYGSAQWTYNYPTIDGFAWTIKPANGGGYVVAGTRNVMRIDHLGNLTSQTTINLPTSPDGSAYSYTEFEEITPLPNGQGFAVTGSCFSNSHSGIYTAKVSWAGGVAWSRINDVVNTSLAGTPVCWVNNSILSNNQQSVITSWRRGPVSSGGPMFAQSVDLATGTQGAITGLNNSLLVREAFATRAHQRLVIGGTSGNLLSVYAYSNSSFLTSAPQQPDPGYDPALPVIATSLGYQTNLYASMPEFVSKMPDVDNAAAMFFSSRTAYQDLTVFPNPTGGQVHIGGLLEVGAILRITDLNGKTIFEQEITADDQFVTTDLNGYAKGMYTVSMIGKQGIVTKKLMLN